MNPILGTIEVDRCKPCRYRRAVSQDAINAGIGGMVSWAEHFMLVENFSVLEKCWSWLQKGGALLKNGIDTARVDCSDLAKGIQFWTLIVDAIVEELFRLVCNSRSWNIKALLNRGAGRYPHIGCSHGCVNPARNGSFFSLYFKALKKKSRALTPYC